MQSPTVGQRNSGSRSIAALGAPSASKTSPRPAPNEVNIKVRGKVPRALVQQTERGLLQGKPVRPRR